MELNILKIASNSTNIKKLQNYTHSAYKKNPMCGDYIDFRILVKKNSINNISFETKSCIYCQASANLLCKFLHKKKLDKISLKLNLIKNFYGDQNIIIGGELNKIFNKKNYKRKECIYLPVKAVFEALKINLSNNKIIFNHETNPNTKNKG